VKTQACSCSVYYTYGSVLAIGSLLSIVCLQSVAAGSQGTVLQSNLLPWHRILPCTYRSRLLTHAHHSLPTNHSLHTHRCIVIKRRNETYHFLCDETDTVGSLHTKLHDVWKQHAPDYADAQLRLLKGDIVLNVEQSLVDAGLVDQSVLYAVLQVAENEYESVDVQKIDLK